MSQKATIILWVTIANDEVPIEELPALAFLTPHEGVEIDNFEIELFEDGMT